MTETPPRPDHYVQPTGPRCPWCLAPAWYSTQEYGFDAVFCVACDAWLEPHCELPGCPDCSRRPERPSELVAELDFGERLLRQ